MPAPELSVVVPCFRALPALEQQLEALAAQENPPAHEILLCDNGPAEDLGPWFARNAHRFPRARVVPARERKGAAYARNRGIAASRAPKLAFCDADDVVSASWMRRAVEDLEQFAVVSGGIVTVGADEFPADTASAQELLRDYGKDRPVVPAGRGAVATALMGGNFAALREVLLGVGGFDAARSGRSEDNDLAARLEQAGHRIMDDSRMAIAYRVPPVSSRGRDAKLFRNGLSAAEVCAVHGLWGTTRMMRPWPGVQLLRAAAAGSAMLARRAPADWPAVRERLLTAAGALVGDLRWRRLCRVPPRAVGLGLDGPAGS